ncbi:MAG: hypothetical protein ABR949_10205 [Candidatus Aquilonibacter sp.]
MEYDVLRDASQRIPESEWKWYGHVAHFICGARCRFHLATEIGKYLVSTVGEMPPTRDAYSDTFEDIGLGRKYETMVFEVGGHCVEAECGQCGLPHPDSYSELDADGYNDAGAATRGHYAMCERAATGKVGRDE